MDIQTPQENMIIYQQQVKQQPIMRSRTYHGFVNTTGKHDDCINNSTIFSHIFPNDNHIVDIYLTFPVVFVLNP